VHIALSNLRKGKWIAVLVSNTTLIFKITKHKKGENIGILRADNADALYPQKLVITSPTSDGRSVGIVRSRTQVTEFSFSLYIYNF
jgi:hypothetical protein